MVDLPVSNRGSDINFVLKYKDELGLPFDLTGFTVALFEPHPKLIGFVVLTITDILGGEIAGRIEWNDEMLNGKVMSFRVRISSGSDDISSPAIWVQIR